jgi:transcriptional regulator with XRE-family HTH domain
MDLGKSIRLALAQKEINAHTLSKELGVMPSTVSIWMHKRRMRTVTLQEVSDYFGLKVSEFVALGE